MTRVQWCLLVSTLVLSVGCSHPATPDLSAYVGADAVTLSVIDDPGSGVQTEYARIADPARRARIVNVLAKYDEKWKPVMGTPPWPPVSLVAERDGETLDIMYLSLPDLESVNVYAQKRIDGTYHYVNMELSDFRELSTLMNAADLSKLSTKQ